MRLRGANLEAGNSRSKTQCVKHPNTAFPNLRTVMARTTRMRVVPEPRHVERQESLPPFAHSMVVIWRAAAISIGLAWIGRQHDACALGNSLRGDPAPGHLGAVYQNN